MNQPNPFQEAETHAPCGCGACAAAPAADAGPAVPGGMRRFRIADMDCATEEAEIRHALAGVEGIRGLRFDLGARVLSISADEAVLPQALAAIGKAGFKPEALGDAVSPPPPRTPWGRLIAALGLALAAEGLDFAFADAGAAKAASLALAALAVGLAGISVYMKGIAALRQGRLSINGLMTVAVTGAFLIGQWPEAAMVMALYAIAEAIEVRAMDRTRNAIGSLLAMAPTRAEVRDGDGRWRRVAVETVAVDATVRVGPGERVPLDGVVIQGQGAVDQSPVTGESLPAEKGPGDTLYAGTINQAAALEMRVTATASDSTLARIIRTVEEAQSARAPMQRFVDRFAAIYTPAIFTLALAVALAAPWLSDWSRGQAFYKALVLLVIACPCALVISTPVTVVSGLAAGARRGILIKGGAYLESARRIKAIALDKTGTITTGKPVLAAFEPLDADVDRETLEVFAKSLAMRSDHPISRAIAEGLPAAAREVGQFHAIPGRGVRGTIDGHSYVLASHRWIEDRAQCTPSLESHLKDHEEAGRSVTFLADDRRVLAIFAVADVIKPMCAQAVAELKSLGVTPAMLTGDNSAAARTVAAQAGITEVHCNLLPEDKLRAIDEFRRRFGVTAMAGDGINDAPALAQADIGFAMGAAGTHTAMEAADVVVMNDDLRRLPEAIRLSRRTCALLRQNIGLTLGIKLAFLLLAMFGNATMWMAVFADMGTCLLVVFNGLRLLRGAGAGISGG
ncbi:MAG: heavy metal translocating P-type ATPase [Azoarcus sp.]|nr:heavy metal translocating P-type ATPase [Azoarcus sp.]